MTPIVLIPGLFATPDFYAAQMPALWQRAAVQVANHARDETMAAIAQRVLDEAPARFALVGHSMGGYVALEVLRQARQRVERVALLVTSARPDAPEQSKRRRALIEQARQGHFDRVADQLYPALVHPSRHADTGLRQRVRDMARDTGADAFVRQDQAIIGRADSKPSLSRIACPALVVVGEDDALTPPELAREIAAGIPRANLVVVPTCGHMSAIEQPDAVTAALVAWLRE
jgi:pimeloyl-ACP methyl ester carboxylesterase